MADTQRLRQAEIYLELAWNRLRQGSESVSKPMQVPHSRELLKQVSLNYGLLYWAQVDFENPYKPPDNYVIQADIPAQIPDPRVHYFTSRAYQSFRRAARFEDNLPTRANGGKAKCYLALAGYVQEKLNGQTRTYT